ncbi:MAG: hypothetical protein PSV22_05890 [Pseudolabrys sp.]|nr:hypothetical protein [Pseudolabrys sp.]
MISIIIPFLTVAVQLAPGGAPVTPSPPSAVPATTASPPTTSLEVLAAIERADAEHAEATPIVIAKLLEVKESLRLANTAKIAPSLGNQGFAERVVDGRRVWEFKTAALKQKRVGELKEQLLEVTAKSKVLSQGDVLNTPFDPRRSDGPSYPRGIIGYVVMDPKKVLAQAESIDSSSVAIVSVRDADTPTSASRRFQFEGWDFTKLHPGDRVRVEGTVLIIAPEPTTTAAPTVFRILKQSLWADDPAFVASRKLRADGFKEQLAEAERANANRREQPTVVK